MMNAKFCHTNDAHKHSVPPWIFRHLTNKFNSSATSTLHDKQRCTFMWFPYYYRKTSQANIIKWSWWWSCQRIFFYCRANIHFVKGSSFSLNIFFVCKFYLVIKCDGFTYRSRCSYLLSSFDLISGPCKFDQNALRIHDSD